MEKIIFFIFAGLSVITALLVVTRRNPMYSAIFLIICFFAFAGLFILLGAQFIAAVQVIVYAGAIMVLFIFVIMLINFTDSSYAPLGQWIFQKIPGLILSLFLFAQIFITLKCVTTQSVAKGNFTAEKISNIGNSELVGQLIFTKYLYPFEVVSILLLVAIVGAVVLAKKKL